jgi:hypothetical protein
MIGSIDWFGWTVLAFGIVIMARLWNSFFGGGSDDDQDGHSGGGPRLQRVRVRTDQDRSKFYK